jgi:hypothetical protein
MKLAFDVGGFDGADTPHYLSLGYRVVCIEASPALADRIRKRLEVRAGPYCFRASRKITEVATQAINLYALLSMYL